MDARLVRVTYIDAEKKDTVARRYGFLLEEEAAFGARVGGKVVDLKGATGDDLDGAEDVRVKAVVEAHQRQGMLQPLGPAARGDADLANQRIEHGGNPGDGL